MQRPESVHPLEMFDCYTTLYNFLVYGCLKLWNECTYCVLHWLKGSHASAMESLVKPKDEEAVAHWPVLTVLSFFVVYREYFCEGWLPLLHYSQEGMGRIEGVNLIKRNLSSNLICMKQLNGVLNGYAHFSAVWETSSNIRSCEG